MTNIFLAKNFERFQQLFLFPIFLYFLFNSLSALPPSAGGMLDPPMYVEADINTRRNSAYQTHCIVKVGDSQSQTNGCEPDFLCSAGLKFPRIMNRYELLK